MRIKNLILVMLFFVPTLCFGYEDACTNPDEFTYDKRCYVTDEQKQQNPYNSVIRYDAIDGRSCTGVLINENGKNYIYTAKHCIDNNRRVKQNIRIKTPNNKTLSAILDNVSSDKDLAKYIIKKEEKEEGLTFASIAKKNEHFLHPVSIRVIGYGDLNVLSDKTIDKFKTKYINYLTTHQGINTDGTQQKYGFYNNSIGYTNRYVEGFMSFLSADDTDFFNQIVEGYKSMKVSNCYYGNSGIKACQAVRGDSGGGVFDSDGNLIGIVIAANGQIGGTSSLLLTKIENVQKD